MASRENKEAASAGVCTCREGRTAKVMIGGNLWNLLHSTGKHILLLRQGRVQKVLGVVGVLFVCFLREKAGFRLTEPVLLLHSWQYVSFSVGGLCAELTSHFKMSLSRRICRPLVWTK